MTVPKNIVEQYDTAFDYWFACFDAERREGELAFSAIIKAAPPEFFDETWPKIPHRTLAEITAAWQVYEANIIAALAKLEKEIK